MVVVDAETPRMELLPLRPALTCQQEIALPLLVRICPESPSAAFTRPDLDVSLVIDRSGSMTGPPMEAAKGAASAAVSSLRNTDRVCVVIYDDRTDVIVPLQPLTEKTPILELIRTITPRGSTALFDGWAAGAEQLKSHQDETRMRRVLLLTDGEANVGLREPDAIASRVADMTHLGIHTTTLGFGRNYNEDLLRAMAASGNGNHFFVEKAGQLLEFFNLELAGLEATVGTSVTLEVQGLHPALQTTCLQQLLVRPEGGWSLDDLVAGCPLNLLFLLKFPPLPADAMGSSLEVARLLLSWTRPRKGVREQEQALLLLPVISPQEWEATPEDGQVREHVAVYGAAMAQAEATRALSLGDPAEAIRALEKGLQELRRNAQSPDSKRLAQRLEGQLEDVKSGGLSSAAKKMTADFYGSVSSRSISMGGGLGRRIGRLRQLANLVKDSDFPARADAVGQFGGVVMDGSLPPLAKERVRGMLVGLAVGDALAAPSADLSAQQRRERFGEVRDYAAPPALSLSGQHAFAVLQAITVDGDFDPAAVAAKLARLDPGADPVLLAFAKNLVDCPWHGAGVAAQTNGALARGLAVLLPNLYQPGILAVDCALLTGMTHRDELAISAGVAFTRLLIDVLRMTHAPAPSWWWDRYAEFCSLMEVGTHYKTPDGAFRGCLSELVKERLPQAQQDSLRVVDFCDLWGSGRHIMETMPVVLYILARHSGVPEEAILRAVNDPQSNQVVAGLVGAAVGALHGPEALPQRWRDQHTYRLGAEDGAVLRVIDKALDLFVKGA